MNTNIFIVLFIGLANIIAGLLVYYAFGKEMEKQKKLFNTMIAIGTMYMVAVLVYSLSSIGIEKVSTAETAKTMLLTAIVPVNTILIAPFLIFSYMRVQQKKLDISKLNVRTIIVGIIALVILISEFFYFRTFQKDLVKKQNEFDNAVAQNELQNQDAQEVESNQTEDETENNNVTNTTEINNSVEDANTTVNTTSTNIISNTTNNILHANEIVTNITD